MRISTKGRYALRMLVDLAEHRNGHFISLRDIAERQNISKKYLEQIIPLFNKADLLKTNRGAQGGYMLAREPREYTVGEVLRLTEGTLVPVSCAGEEPAACGRSADCAMLPVWRGLSKAINDYLDSVTLQDILDQGNSLGGDDYVI